MDVEIGESWSLIEAALRACAPRLIDTLGPAATDLEIAGLERAIGLRLPGELKASLRCHNGQRDPSRLWSFTDGGMLLSASEIAGRWRMVDSIHRDLSSRPAPIAGYTPEPWWKPTLIPFTDDNGDLLCVDTDGTLGTRCGEVIWFVHDDSLSGPIAESYGRWLRNIAAKVREGALVVEQGFSHLRTES
jgi:cell wall assembly regulator SMI1